MCICNLSGDARLPILHCNSVMVGIDFLADIKLTLLLTRFLLWYYRKIYAAKPEISSFLLHKLSLGKTQILAWQNLVLTLPIMQHIHRQFSRGLTCNFAPPGLLYFVVFSRSNWRFTANMRGWKMHGCSMLLSSHQWPFPAYWLP